MHEDTEWLYLSEITVLSISEVIQRQGHTVTGAMIRTGETVALPLSPWTGVRLKPGLHGEKAKD